MENEASASHPKDSSWPSGEVKETVDPPHDPATTPAASNATQPTSHTAIRFHGSYLRDMIPGINVKVQLLI